jgi:hypothetical protein
LGFSITNPPRDMRASRLNASALPLAMIGVAVAVTGATLGSDAWVSGDSVSALREGRELARSGTAAFDGAATPHPLLILIAAGLSPLGIDGAYSAFSLLFARVIPVVLAALLFWLTYRICASWLAGAVAVLLAATSREVLVTVYSSYLDPLFATLLLTAVGLELRRARRGASVLVLCFLAGLLRPEAWILGGVYWAWLTPVLSLRGRVTTAVLVIGAPMVWSCMDLIATGHPFYSFSFTEALADRWYEPRGRLQNLSIIPSQLGGYLPLPILGLAVVGIRASWRSRPRAAVVLGIAGALPLAIFAGYALSGLPTNARYLFVPALTICTFAGAGTVSLQVKRCGRLATVPGVVVSLLLAGYFGWQLSVIRQGKATLAMNAAGVRSIRAFAAKPHVRRLLAQCASVGVSRSRIGAYYAYFLDVPTTRFFTGADAEARAAPAYVGPAPSSGQVPRLFARPDPREASHQRDVDLHPVIQDGSWAVYVRGTSCRSARDGSS